MRITENIVEVAKRMGKIEHIHVADKSEKKMTKVETKKPVTIEADATGMLPTKLSHVTLKVGATYYVVRDRSGLPNVDDLEWVMRPYEVIAVPYLGSANKRWCFDDGRLTFPDYVYLPVPPDFPTDIQPHNDVGQKEAKRLMNVTLAGHYQVAVDATSPNHEEFNAACAAWSSGEREIAVAALGGDPEKIGKGRKIGNKEFARDSIKAFRKTIVEDSAKLSALTKRHKELKALLEKVSK